MKTISDFDDVADWSKMHRILWTSDAFRTLARIHDTITTASSDLYGSLVPKGDSGTITLAQMLELTSVGRKPGLDTPRWWVFSEVPDISAFWNDTKLIFHTVQTLLRDAEMFGRSKTPDYESLIVRLQQFLEDHSTELNSLAAYVGKLARDNASAPAILFSGVVWGDTRRADRSPDHYAHEACQVRVAMAGELALGIRRRDITALYDAWSEIMEERSHEWEDADIALPVADLLQHVQMLVRESLIEYFSSLRDSVRHLDKLCQDYLKQENLHADMRFLRHVIKHVCSPSRPVETELWDVKELLNLWRVPPQERENAAIQFAEDVAAFANRHGGILIVGISETRDVTGVTDLENRMKHLENIVRTQTDSSEDFVRIRPVEVDVGGQTRTCLLVVAAQTVSPVGVRQKNGSYSYPRRVGPGIERVARESIATEKEGVKRLSFGFLRELAMWTELK